MNLPSMLAMALLGAMMSTSQAFTLDAAGYAGGELAGYPYELLVPGYGEIVLESETGAELVVNPGYGNGLGSTGMPLHFNRAESVKLSFSSLPCERLKEFTNRGGRRGSGWPVKPEPAYAGLGIVGLVVLLLGHRR